MRKFLKLMKLFPRLFPTYKVHVKVFMTCLTFFSPFVDRYFFIQRSFSLDFYAKNGSVFGCWIWENIRSLVSWSVVSRPLTRRCMERLEVKNCLQTTSVFSSLFWLKHFFKMINLRYFHFWGWWAVAFLLICSNFLVLCGKMPWGCGGCGSRSELCGSAPPHPVRCPAIGTLSWWRSRVFMIITRSLL